LQEHANPELKEARPVFPWRGVFDLHPRLGYDRTMITAHGFRGMASTLLHERGWPSDVIERQRSHAERNAVKAAYNHADHLPARRKMMQAWADHLDSLRNSAEFI
jgi:integrase